MIDLAKINEELSERGYTYLSGLPADMNLVSTFSALGPLVRQYSGEFVRDIRPLPGVQPSQVSAYNRSELTPHTEWYEFTDTPPRLVGLFCVHSAEGAGGETTLADGYQMLREYDHAERSRLFTDPQVWASAGLRHENQERLSQHSILSTHDGVTILRFSTSDLRGEDDFVSAYVAHGVNFFRKNHTAIKIKNGDMLIWDNWRMLHARRAFDDPGRHLKRILIGSPT